MRHRVFGKKLSRRESERLALAKGLLKALFSVEKIATTLAKAQMVSPLAEKLVTAAKNPTLANRRKILAALGDEELTARLIGQIAPRFKERKGGFTRIIKLGRRSGDDALMVRLGLVEGNGKEDTKVAKEAEPIKEEKE
ncbi:50S ribosomal protein L17 [Candidatus Shapirobacteria bacterium]|nr:50S ribosomal protein L17 [Candidatus Shapirobacteria bacterium]